MRPVYETTLDLSNEKQAAELVGRKWNCDVQKTKKFYHCDYVAIRNRNIVSFMEIKTRKNDHNKYPTYMISADKICSCLTMCEKLKRPFFLIVGFTDGIYFTNTFPNESLVMGGRFDRGDASDVEPCLLIPMSNFRKLI